MATRKNSTKNLFIKQGDNSNFDLFMKSPEFIKDFTNWESKTSSLEVTRWFCSFLNCSKAISILNLVIQFFQGEA